MLLCSIFFFVLAFCPLYVAYQMFKAVHWQLSNYPYKPQVFDTSMAISLTVFTILLFLTSRLCWIAR